MKRITIALCGVLFLTACQEKKHGAFVVQGLIENAAGTKVSLMELPFNSQQALVLDSGTLDKKGSFTLRGMAKEEGIYRLVLENGPDVILINDSKNIRIRLNVNDYRRYKVEGSNASQKLHDLFEAYIDKDSALMATFKDIDTLSKQPKADSLLALSKKKRDDQLADINNTVKTFITNSSSAAATFYAIGLASRTMPPEEIKPMVDKAVARFKNHSGLLAVQKMIASQTTAKTAAPQYMLMNQQAPDITMPDLKGQTISLNNFKGKYVLVDFWASWCGPCRQENPNVVEAYNKFKDKNFTILGVSLDQDKNAWLKAVEKDKLSWTHISDLKQWESPVVPAYGIEGIPFNVLLDPTGKIIASNLRGAGLQSKLQEVLK
jgi:peroxiredoxin